MSVAYMPYKRYITNQKSWKFFSFCECMCWCDELSYFEKICQIFFGTCECHRSRIMSYIVRNIELFDFSSILFKLENILSLLFNVKFYTFNLIKSRYNFWKSWIQWIGYLKCFHHFWHWWNKYLHVLRKLLQIVEKFSTTFCDSWWEC